MEESKQMPKLKENQKMSRNEGDFHYSKNIICCKWWNNTPVLLLGVNVDVMIGTSNVMMNKVSATKAPVFCPIIIKLSNNGMGTADIMD